MTSCRFSGLPAGNDLEQLSFGTRSGARRRWPRRERSGDISEGLEGHEGFERNVSHVTYDVAKPASCPCPPDSH